MSVKRGSDAITELGNRLGDSVPQTDGPDFWTISPPGGFESPAPPDGWIWDSTPLVPPLRSESAYDLAIDGWPEGPSWKEYLHETSLNAVYEPPINTADDDDPWPATAEEEAGDIATRKELYCRYSVDVTMRGGTTSGVVYPLAICEIARRFRLRNVGGASAGAIAAAAGAAAELGRRSADLGDRAAADLSDTQKSQGHVRRGFAGLADCMAWIAEADRPTDAKPEYRLAQLFRPTSDALPLYRILVAGMQKKWGGLILLAGGLLNWPWRIVALLVTLLGVALTGIMIHDPDTDVFQRSGSPWWPAISGLAGTTLVVAGIAFCFVTYKKIKPAKPVVVSELEDPILPGNGVPGREWNKVIKFASFGAGSLILGIALLALPSLVSDISRPRYWIVLLPAFIAIETAILSIHGWRIYRVLKNGNSLKYGLIAGSTSKEVIRWGIRGWWNKRAGLAKPTVDRALVPWLSDTLRELAGLPSGINQLHVLKFGHLWWGADWSGGIPSGSKACSDPRDRIVNLELMTSELVQGVPYRFPLELENQIDKDGLPKLYFRLSDLEEVFPEEVRSALLTGTPIEAREVPTGDAIKDLYPFPEPWNFPVVCAARLSLSLPGMFQAVRAYRRINVQEVQDDFGRQIVHPNGEAVEYPRESTTDITTWVEPLWFSDGGITSNFPIHFFDSPLPIWPTFGISLGDHPKGFEWQDVWLPPDWQSGTLPASPLKKGFPSFAGAIVGTARGWRDTTQVFMPGYRGRIAWVRQGAGEGGTNLFMERGTIASMALRGAIAGARLRRRFELDPYWHRHQWLRLRSSLANLEQLRGETAVSLSQPLYESVYANPTANPADIVAMNSVGGDPIRPGPGNWFTSDEPEAFWAAAQAVKDGMKTPARPPGEALSTNPFPPFPAPALRQVPPV